MDEFIGQLGRFLSNTVVVHVYSYPHFAVEALLAAFLCVAHALLIHEVNTLVRRVNARAACKLRNRHSVKEVDSFCSYRHSVTSIQAPRGCFGPRMLSRGGFSSFDPYERYVPAVTAAAMAAPLGRAGGGAYFAPARPPSVGSHLSWAIRRGDSAFRGGFEERLERLLATTPSEYVRHDKERKNREAGLRSCLQSLTSILERALDGGGRLDINDDASKEAVRRSINAIRETFESRVSAGDGRSGGYDDLSNFPSASLQSLIAQSTTRRTLDSSLAPNLKPSTMAYPVTDVYMKEDRDRQPDRNSKGDSADSLFEGRKSCDDLNELFRQEGGELADGSSKGALDAAY